MYQNAHAGTSGAAYTRLTRSGKELDDPPFSLGLITKLWKGSISCAQDQLNWRIMVMITACHNV